MIDANRETLLSLTQAAKTLPTRRGGKRPHVSCLYRWTTTGCKGVILESIQVGGTRCTSQEALGRFFEALTRANPTCSSRSSTRRDGTAAVAEQQLQREGI